MSTLQLRLKNCIQTILDFEPGMRTCTLGLHFSKELDILKAYLAHVDHMSLAEEDVLHMEKATATFLDELKFFLKTPQPKRILQ
ncbi:MAG: hypothetical protein IJU37_10070 [Desulfovibrio sp.]|nr:hypothetical protein [Desulfovibrio sp.]